MFASTVFSIYSGSSTILTSHEDAHSTGTEWTVAKKKRTSKINIARTGVRSAHKRSMMRVNTGPHERSFRCTKS